ncbi:hypothetical protein HF325_005080 [Metschnikowia pulcherrima]|uniref:Uncharacterized protein n=1 Tax=Metschnikowia pulcherrima TaxID=27326 RepID=A0A8H7GP86_9ASCO|nr:hypothetical protein HF325_005080 [Metschnikowia pulcherrima]
MLNVGVSGYGCDLADGVLGCKLAPGVWVFDWLLFTSTLSRRSGLRFCSSCGVGVLPARKAADAAACAELMNPGQ